MGQVTFTHYNHLRTTFMTIFFFLFFY